MMKNTTDLCFSSSDALETFSFEEINIFAFTSSVCFSAEQTCLHCCSSTQLCPTNSTNSTNFSSTGLSPTNSTNSTNFSSTGHSPTNSTNSTRCSSTQLSPTDQKRPSERVSMCMRLLYVEEKHTHQRHRGSILA